MSRHGKKKGTIEFLYTSFKNSLYIFEVDPLSRESPLDQDKKITKDQDGVLESGPTCLLCKVWLK